MFVGKVRARVQRVQHVHARRSEPEFKAAESGRVWFISVGETATGVQ